VYIIKQGGASRHP